jgi:hypothetical protein
MMANNKPIKRRAIQEKHISRFISLDPEMAAPSSSNSLQIPATTGSESQTQPQAVAQTTENKAVAQTTENEAVAQPTENEAVAQTTENEAVAQPTENNQAVNVVTDDAEAAQSSAEKPDLREMQIYQWRMQLLGIPSK